MADPWSTAAGPIPNQFDVQAIATHEAGHFLGVSHSTVGLPLDRNGSIVVGPETATMVPTGGPNSIDFRSLAQDDIASYLRTYSRNATPPAAQTAGRARPHSVPTRQRRELRTRDGCLGLGIRGE